MCNEYARQIALGTLAEEFSQTKPLLPAFAWAEGRIPNDLDGKASVRIRDTAPIVRLQGERLIGEMVTWAWAGPRGKPVFNFVSEKRDFARSDRVLILATGFYEYTEPAAPKVKLKDRHLFTLPGQPWFWIAGIVKEGCFTMLTVAPGPDVSPYHDRQIVVLPPADGIDWLTLTKSQGDILATPPAGTFDVVTVRKDGVAIDALTTS